MRALNRRRRGCRSPRVALRAAVAAAIYVSPMLMWAVMFGDVVLQRLDAWAWRIPAVPVVAVFIAVRKLRSKPAG